MTAKVMFAYHAAFGAGPMNCRILEQICICLETPWQPGYSVGSRKPGVSGDSSACAQH
jgi:hypothetical protein